MVTPLPPPDWSALEQVIGHPFACRDLLITALTHRSFVNEQAEPSPHNERLEFLGDAVVSLVVAHLLMEQYPTWSEGALSKVRASLVCEAGLQALAQELGLGRFLRLGKGEEQTGGRTKPSLLADAFEALAAALYLDAGWERTHAFLRAWFAPHVALAASRVELADAKTTLQELVQGRFKRTPTYELVGAHGAEHDKVFVVRLLVDEVAVAEGSGHTKKEAEHQAAAEVLGRIHAGEAVDQLWGGKKR